MRTLSPLRVLVVGAGPAAAHLHLPRLAALQDRGDIALISICDIVRERAAEARRAFGFLEESSDAIAELERKDVDAVYIFGNAQLHYEYGIRALQNGKHLFVEKPIAPSFRLAQEMAKQAASRGLIAVGGHNRRFYKSLDMVRTRTGKAGWRSVEAIFHKPEFGKPPLFGADSWLTANGIHALDALIFGTGGLPIYIDSVVGNSGAGVPNVFSVLMRWPDGAQGVFLSNNEAGARREEYIFHAPRETFRILEDELTVEKDGICEKTRYPTAESFAAEHDAFLEAIRTGVEPRHSLSALAPSLFVAELIEGGFNGQVEFPLQHGILRPSGSPAKSILVVQPGSLQPALTQLLPNYRLVSLDDVRRAPTRRSDVVAAILGRAAPPLSSDILDRLPRLSIVGIMGLSLAHHDPETLLARNLKLVNASTAYAETVADFAFALAILGRRRAFASNDIMHMGGWGVGPRQAGVKRLLRQVAQSARPILRAVGLEPSLLKLWRRAAPLTQAAGGNQAHDLKDTVVGLIGWGANARAFAERLVQAGAHILVYSTHAASADMRSNGVHPASLAEVLAADIVSLHRGLTADTRHFLGAAELARLRPGAVLINVARGALIEPQALLARLKQRDIFACLDTFEVEPLPASHPLRRLPNVFLTSHIAGGSAEMHDAAAEEVVRKVAALLEGEAIPSLSGAQLRSMT